MGNQPSLCQKVVVPTYLHERIIASQILGDRAHLPSIIPDLVGGFSTPLKNMKVNWDDEIPNIWENKIDVPNHQAEMAYRAQFPSQREFSHLKCPVPIGRPTEKNRCVQRSHRSISRLPAAETDPPGLTFGIDFSTWSSAAVITVAFPAVLADAVLAVAVAPRPACSLKTNAKTLEDNLGGFHSHGGTPKWMVCTGKSRENG